MTCTYDLSTDTGRIRLAIGDTDCTTPQLSDEEIAALVALGDSWQEAALWCVDALIAKYAVGSVDMRMGPRAESRSQRIANLQALKAHLAASYGLAGTLLSVLAEEALEFGWVSEEDEDE